VHARAEVHQPAGRRDQGGQQVRGQDVDGEDVRESVDRLDAPGLSVADASVVDHGVIGSDQVGLLCDLAGPLDAGQVADDDVLGGRERPASVIGALIVTPVQGDRVAKMGEQFSRHQPEAVARTSNQYPCHRLSLLHCLLKHRRSR
jgi:hypothetical protein